MMMMMMTNVLLNQFIVVLFYTYALWYCYMYSCTTVLFHVLAGLHSKPGEIKEERTAI